MDDPWWLAGTLGTTRFEFLMTGARILNVNIAVSHACLSVGSQNHDHEHYSINCAALI